MPAKTEEQQQLMGIALHNPEKVYAKNRGVLKMSKGDLRDFAETKGLRGHKKKKGLGGWRKNAQSAREPG